ncbi:MAG: hypothetical protein ACR2IE_16840 [Candidatus Sumerlaeaceae bacterium]
MHEQRDGGSAAHGRQWSAGNNADLGATLLQVGLSARRLRRGTAAHITFTPSGVSYEQKHDRGRIIRSAQQLGTTCTVTVSSCSSQQPVTQAIADAVCDALVNAGIKKAFSQPESQTDQLLTFYNDARRPTSVHAFRWR